MRALESMMLLVCIFLLGQWQSVTSFRQYQNLIPNGRNVPHSCLENFFWHGIGHQSFKGAGPLNRFGRDFLKYNKVWKKLCPVDSDGDGMTNGQELGDPDCKWVENQMPERTTNITNPGICDPLDSLACKGRNFFLKCEEEIPPCSVIQEDGMKNITIRMPVTKIPARQTTYMHTFVELPQDGDYHLLAATPFLDNAAAVHHIALFGCDEYNGPIKEPLNTPRIDTGWPYCSNLMVGWSVGTKRMCRKDDFGVRFGAKKGYKMALLEVHWNNPEGNPNLTDSSGFTLFYTTKLRKYDLGVMQIGQTTINIPPRSDRVVVSGTCRSDCTKEKLNGPIYISGVSHHMHYTGIAAKTELFRNGTKIVDIANDEHYNYDNHKPFKLKPRIEMLPGDEIKMTCVFTSKYKTTAMYYGQGVDAEMCFGYIFFYPVENGPLSRCIDGIPYMCVY